MSNDHSVDEPLNDEQLDALAGGGSNIGAKTTSASTIASRLLQPVPGRTTVTIDNRIGAVQTPLSTPTRPAPTPAPTPAPSSTTAPAPTRQFNNILGHLE